MCVLMSLWLKFEKSLTKGDNLINSCFITINFDGMTFLICFTAKVVIREQCPSNRYFCTGDPGHAKMRGL